MVHGGGHTGKTYETTPDGREGWYTSFTRRGFASYVMDDPNRGRACCDPTRVHQVGLGTLPFTDLPNMNIYTKQFAHFVFRFGTDYPTPFTGLRFPLQAIDQYAPQWVMTYRDPEENDKITNGIIAAIDAIGGPVIVMTHSQSGPRGLEAVLQRTNVVKALISVEPAGFNISEDDAVALKDIPLLTMYGDNVDAVGFWANLSEQAKTSIETVSTAGGNATYVSLPEIGIKGNSHMMMMGNNNEQLADMIEHWIKKNVERRPHYPWYHWPFSHRH